MSELSRYATGFYWFPEVSFCVLGYKFGLVPPKIETIILPPINWYVCSILLNTWTTLSLSNGWRGLAIFEPQYIEFTLGIYKSNGLFLVFWDNSLLNSIFLRPAHFAVNGPSTFHDCCKSSARTSNNPLLWRLHFEHFDNAKQKENLRVLLVVFYLSGDFSKLLSPKNGQALKGRYIPNI